MLLGMHYKSVKVPDYLKSNWYVLTLLLIPVLYPDFSPVNSAAKYRMWLNYEVLLVMSAVFFSVVYMVPDNNPFLVNKLGDFIGKISFSLYLLHMPLIILLNEFSMVTELKLILFVSLSVLVAYVSYRFIEVPFAKGVRMLTKPTKAIVTGNVLTKRI